MLSTPMSNGVNTPSDHNEEDSTQEQSETRSGAEQVDSNAEETSDVILDFEKNLEYLTGARVPEKYQKLDKAKQNLKKGKQEFKEYVSQLAADGKVEVLLDAINKKGEMQDRINKLVSLQGAVFEEQGDTLYGSWNVFPLQYVLKELAEFKDEKVVQQMLEADQYLLKEVPEHFVMALGKIATPKAREYLKKQAVERDDYLKKTILLSLLHSETEFAKSILEKQIQNENFADFSSVEYWTECCKGIPSLADLLLKRFAKESNPEAFTRIAYVLASIENSKCVNAIWNTSSFDRTLKLHIFAHYGPNNWSNTIAEKMESVLESPNSPEEDVEYAIEILANMKDRRAYDLLKEIQRKMPNNKLLKEAINKFSKDV